MHEAGRISGRFHACARHSSAPGPDLHLLTLQLSERLHRKSYKTHKKQTNTRQRCIIRMLPRLIPHSASKICNTHGHNMPHNSFQVRNSITIRMLRTHSSISSSTNHNNNLVASTAISMRKMLSFSSLSKQINKGTRRRQEMRCTATSSRTLRRPWRHSLPN